MPNKMQIDQIERDGIVYEFVDSEARNQTVANMTKAEVLHDVSIAKITEEIERAKAAEEALERTKMSLIPDMGLSSNDFTDSYKAYLDNPTVFTGATATGDGRKGVVIAPLKGDQDKFLKGDGTWGTPHDTTYERATQEADGLLSRVDKRKLDNMNEDTDEEVSCETRFRNNTITQVLGNGKTKTTVFNSDGSITETIVQEGADTITLNTVFTADGNIIRTRS